MTNKELTFNDLPQVVAELRDEVSCMKALLLNLQNRPIQQREQTPPYHARAGCRVHKHSACDHLSETRKQGNPRHQTGQALGNLP